MQKILAVDGNSILNRAYYATPKLTNSQGHFVNGILGFFNMLIKFAEKYQPNRVYIAFDVHAPTFRHEKFAEYKAGRHPTPGELLMQFPPLKDILRQLKVQTLELAGYEADDIIGTISKLDADEIYLATGDRDCLQLVSPNVKMIYPKSAQDDILYDEAAVERDFEVTPEKFIQLKALMGDKSDNIPGAAGVGEKTATELIKAYGSIENIFNHLDELKPALKQKMMDFKDKSQESLFLVTIDTNVPIKLDDNEFDIKKWDLEIFKTHGLNSLYKRLKEKYNCETQYEQIGFAL